MKNIVVINGIHGAGKSTIAYNLSSKYLEYKYFEEIGRILRNKVKYNALESGVFFDETVLACESKRDIKILKSKSIPIIETWHIGNYAYALERSPELTDKYEKILTSKLSIFNVYGIFLTIDRDTFERRCSEKINPNELDKLYEFYRRITESTLKLYEHFNISYNKVENIVDNKEAILPIVHKLIQSNFKK